MKEFIEKHKSLVEILVKLSFFVVMLFVIFNFVIGITTQTSDSMAPNIKYHDHIIYSRINADYYLRDVVVYEYEGNIYIGRLVGVPNTLITVDDEGNLFQNDYLVYEDNIFLMDNSEEYTCVLGENQYFVLCDNRKYHTDSRNFGPIDKSQIIGVVIMDIRRFGL